MISQKYFNYSIFLLLLSFLSCKDSNEYRVDSTFVDYLHRFETEASKRDKNFDIASTGLIIEFADLKDNTAGLTHYENPIRIEIDKTYWKAISKSAGADLMKEELIFHELGHGLLNRKHLNSTLENGEWKSIMCGGDKINGRSWNINYKGFRREYYINELFNESTLAPEFSSLQLMVDTTGYRSELYFSFNSIDQAGWEIKDTLQYKTSISNGRLKFESKVTDIFLVYIKTKIDIQTDFSYEFSIQYPTGEAVNQYGMIFGFVPTGSEGINDPVEYFTINNNKKMFIGNRSWYSYFTELNQNSVLSNGINKFKVVKIRKLLYYFINNTYTYCSEIEVSETGNHFGFMVPPKGTVYLENLNISQRIISGSPLKINQNMNVEFELKTIKPFNNTILNK
ncbi:MAG: hypothetical protein GZ091_11885 [Paludibacter sp.]|nr:hypothetical protein [Paludibacter sp.]